MFDNAPDADSVLYTKLFSLAQTMLNCQHVRSHMLEKFLMLYSGKEYHGFAQTDPRFLNILSRNSANFFEMLVSFVRSIFVGWRTNFQFDWGLESSVTCAALHGLQSRSLVHQSVYHSVGEGQNDFFAMSLTRNTAVDDFPLIFVAFPEQGSFPDPSIASRYPKLSTVASKCSLAVVDFRLEDFRLNIGSSAQIVAFPIHLTLPDNVARKIYEQTRQCMASSGYRDEATSPKNFLPAMRSLMDTMNEILTPWCLHPTKQPHFLSRYLAGVLAASVDSEFSVSFLEPKQDTRPADLHQVESSAFLIEGPRQKVCVNIIESSSRLTTSFESPPFLGELIRDVAIDPDSETVVYNLFVGFEHHEDEFETIFDGKLDSVRKQLFVAKQNTAHMLTHRFTAKAMEHTGNWKKLVQNSVNDGQPDLEILAKKFAQLIKSCKVLVCNSIF